MRNIGDVVFKFIVRFARAVCNFLPLVKLLESRTKERERESEVEIVHV